MTALDWLGWLLSALLVLYFISLSLISTVLTIVGWRGVNDYVRRRPMRSYRDVAESPMSLPVSIIVPGYNEEATIVASVQALLASQFGQLEIVVVNDGSKDATAAQLIEAFDMVRVERSPSSGLESQPVNGVYFSRVDRRVVLVDKQNGGKADALNAGINHARYPLVCCIDADTLLDPWALARLVWEFEAHPATVAVGGIVRVVNGSTFSDGRLVEVRTPRSLLANLQILEYLRAFLGARIGWSRLNALVIISGAFGLFRKAAVVEVGGYDRTTVGEDAEMVLRLHRRFSQRGKPARITFFPDPICWTEVPESLRILRNQRDRWQRGLAQMLWRHRDMLFRPRYRSVGMLALPYFWLFELIGPAVEFLGYIYVVTGLILGFVWPPFALAVIILSTVYGVLLSLLVILMEERAFARYPSWRDLRTLTFVAFLENFGYRQYLAWVRLRALWNLRKQGGWGHMTRKGFADNTSPTAPS
jgi:cellulose synthase/poly-beta-1,6-N-acetylglucosamine synthase-like glycosyltransferase